MHCFETISINPGDTTSSMTGASTIKGTLSLLEDHLVVLTQTRATVDWEIFVVK